MIYSRPDTIISETKILCIVVDSSNDSKTQFPPPAGDSEKNIKKLFNSKVPPACGGLGGQDIRSKMLKQVQPGERIIDLDMNPALVSHTKSCQYNGKIIEVTLKESNHTLYALPENLVLCQRKINKLSTNGHWDDIPEHHFQKARQLRQQTTQPEKKLWQYLRREQLGVKFRSQHPINRYIVDFYARKAGMVVEVDGESAHTYPEQIKHDQERNKFMEGIGLKVLRFSALDVMSNIEGVISEIEYYLREVVPDNFSNGQWRYAKHIKAGDKIFIGKNLSLCEASAIREFNMDCDVTILDLEGSDNFISDSFVFHI